jgi:hypothetical protein
MAIQITDLLTNTFLNSEGNSTLSHLHGKVRRHYDCDNTVHNKTETNLNSLIKIHCG